MTIDYTKDTITEKEIVAILKENARLKVKIQAQKNEIAQLSKCIRTIKYIMLGFYPTNQINPFRKKLFNGDEVYDMFCKHDMRIAKDIKTAIENIER